MSFMDQKQAEKINELLEFKKEIPESPQVWADQIIQHLEMLKALQGDDKCDGNPKIPENIINDLLPKAAMLTMYGHNLAELSKYELMVCIGLLARDLKAINPSYMNLSIFDKEWL